MHDVISKTLPPDPLRIEHRARQRPADLPQPGQASAVSRTERIILGFGVWVVALLLTVAIGSIAASGF